MMHMRTAEKIRNILEKSRFGLTAGEISKKSGIREESAELMLERMVRENTVKKTRAGKNFFYRTAKLAVLLMILVPLATAQQLDSTSYKIVAEVIDAGGGKADSGNMSLITSFGQPVSDRRFSESYDACAGFVCSFLEILRGEVTFLIEFNISGSSNDQVFVGTAEGVGKSSTGSYSCIHDTSITGSPVLGAVFSGSKLAYVKATPGNSFSLRISQDLAGNRIIIPVTSGNCSVVEARIPQIAQYGLLLQPFGIINEAANAVELALSYRAFDLVGTFDRTGPFTVVIEKNATDGNKIIIRPE